MRKASEIFLYVFMVAVVVTLSWHFKSVVFAFFTLGTVWPLVISAILIGCWQSLGAWLWIMAGSLLYVAWIVYGLAITLFGVTDALIGIAYLFMGFYAAPIFCIFWGLAYVVERMHRKRIANQTIPVEPKS